MHITIFEEKDFVNWCNEDIQEHKEAILLRACGYLLCTTTRRKDIKDYSVGETVLFSCLDLVQINYEVTEGDGKIFNSCLSDRCMTIFYDDIAMEEYCVENNLSYNSVEIFLNKLSNFITDSVIVEWKLKKGLFMPCVKVENPKFSEPVFFPVSYYLQDLILVTERATGKKVKFTPTKQEGAYVSKDNITCYFTVDRLESEYLIATQLLKVYLTTKNFKAINSYNFTSMENWNFEEETVSEALHIILQNKLVGIIISQLYPMYSNSVIYSLLSYKTSEDYMSPTCRYLCEYSKKNKSCSGCSGIDDIFNLEGVCPLYKDGSILDKFYTLDELSTPEKHDEIVNNLINTFTSK